MPIPWKKFKAYIDLYLVLRRALLCSAICLELKKWGFPSIPKSTDPSHFSVTLLLMAFPGGRGRGVSHCVIKIHKPGGVALIFKSRQPSQCPVITQKPSIVLESLNLLRDVPLRDQAWSWDFFVTIPAYFTASKQSQYKNSIILNPPTDPWQKVSGGFSSVAWLTQISPLPVAALRRPRFQVFWFQNKLAEIWSDANTALLPAGSWVPVGGLLATRLKSNIWASGHILIGMSSWTKNFSFPQPSYRGLWKDAESLSCLPVLDETVTHTER